ncbi:MAG TPA: hypothetical protein VIV06_09315, partial [Candidatus Limnocylindrales bacterium]
MARVDAPAPRLARETDLVDWDEHAVEAAGGHVFQSRAWAEHRARSGWRPRFFVCADGARVLALERRWPIVGGGSAYVPRGPVPIAGGAERADLLIAVAAALAEEGTDVVAADPEVPADDERYLRVVREAGFRPIEEIQPSRHRIALALRSLDEAAALAGIAKSTRQRIRAAERGGLRVVRQDTRAADGPGEGFVEPDEPPEPTFERFADMLEATGERRGFRFGRADFVAWWTAALGAGHVVFLEARDADEPIAGLLLYRHG